MADYELVERIVAELPEVTVGEKWHRRHWLVAGKGFVWERPLSKADIRRFGDAPVPAGPFLGVVTEDLHEREAIVASGVLGVFTIEHFADYPAYLVDLSVVQEGELRRLVLDAWCVNAPADVARVHLDR